ncbi:MAG: hypothetical protein DRG35_06335 [Deltaproteobacteria bacterium]|nr:MAG: hypothetical protein B6I32_00135 [Desulfobacterium sp. 4572_20]RLB13791.1 MAG: hypothetical protein DRG35_06335 [Deltaproteobacteria bacterium]
MRKIQNNHINGLQILIGVAGLSLGTFVYVIDRPPEATYFIYFSKINVSLYNTFPNVFGVIGNSLPDLLHVFSFILLTAGLLSCQKKCSIIVCISWFSVDFLFEIFQKYNAMPLEIIPNWFKAIPFLENTENYFKQGTFDIADLIAIALGAVVAYVILLTTNNRREIS